MEYRLRTEEWKNLTPAHRVQRYRFLSREAQSLARGAEPDLALAYMRIAKSWSQLADAIDQHSLYRPLRIAVVDDLASVRNALGRLLSTQGHRVDTFANGRDFLSAASTIEASCLLLDIQLGDMSGLDLARQLKIVGFSRPIIFMTASDDEKIRRQCLDFGCVAFLQKPIQQAELLDAILTAVEVKDHPTPARALVADLAGQ